MKKSDIEKIAEYYETHDTADSMADAELITEPASNPMVTTSLRLPLPVMSELRSVARARGVKVTQLIREWVEERLAATIATGDQTISVSALLAFVTEQTRKSA